MNAPMPQEQPISATSILPAALMGQVVYLEEEDIYDEDNKSYTPGTVIGMTTDAEGNLMLHVDADGKLDSWVCNGGVYMADAMDLEESP